MITTTFSKLRNAEACAERVLHLYEDKYPDDPRPRKAIETKRAWLRGEASDGELAAAGAAAGGAELAWQRQRLTELLGEEK